MVTECDRGDGCRRSGVAGVVVGSAVVVAGGHITKPTLSYVFVLIIKYAYKLCINMSKIYKKNLRSAASDPRKYSLQRLFC